MIKVLLACKVDEDDSHSKLLIALLVTLRSIYRKQAIVTTHKQSLKRSERTKKTIRKTSKPSKFSCNIKQFLTVPKLCEFGLIRKFRSKSFALQKESTQTELRKLSYEQKKFEYEFEQISKFENFKKLT